MIIGARCPSGATEEVKFFFDSYLAVLDKVRSDDVREEKNQGLERLQVLDKGWGNVWSPPVPSLLAASAPSTPRKRTREEPEADGAVDDAFDSFKGISPKKKTRASA